MELEVEAISRYIKPKLKLLKTFRRHKYSQRLHKELNKLLCGEISDEYRELKKDLQHFDQVLERSQDTLLSILTTEQSREGIELSLVMRRIAEVSLFFIPKIIVGSFFGMNCYVPFQAENHPNLIAFFVIVGLAATTSITLYSFRARILKTE
jgi:Mg2+ and Co2+ transporter CorA